ncbi:MAG: DDE-type integrase/transposase/recombinase [Chakrabartia sp.]
MLESFVTKKRDKSAALAFMKHTLKRHGQAETIVTDGLKSYPAAMESLAIWIVGKWVDGSTTVLKIHTFLSDAKSVSCGDLEG